MKIFVTGATGVLGRRVIRNLVAKRISVVALSRSAGNAELLRKEHVEIRHADLFNKREMIEATEGCDAILHLATSIPKKAIPKLSDWEMNDKIRDQGTANLIDAAIANDIKTFICQSVTLIYGQQHGDLVSSGTPLPTKQVEMAASTIKMEMMLIDRLPGRYIIFRFGSFYSEDDFFTNLIIDNVSNGKMPMVGDGKYYMNWIHLDDAASALVFGVENQDKLRGRILNVTDQHPILYADMLNYLSKVLRHKSPFYLPAWIARLILGKNGYAVLTNSYRVGSEPLLQNWKPVYKNFLSGISEILDERKNCSYKTVDQ